MLLGTGGDNSSGGAGEFFEAAMTSGYPSDATENAVQSGLTAADHGSGGTSGATGPIASGLNNSKCMDDNGFSTASGTATAAPNGSGQPQNGTLVNPVSGKCLDDNNSHTANETQLQIWDCNGGANQKWAVP